MDVPSKARLHRIGNECITKLSGTPDERIKNHSHARAYDGLDNVCWRPVVL